MDKLSDIELNVAITTALDIFIIVDDGEVMTTKECGQLFATNTDW
jgi:hypothetical protein